MESKPIKKPVGRYALKYRGQHCLNCNFVLDIDDTYCPNCSQANSTKKLTLKDFFEEFFSSIISYDSKLTKTLLALVTNPGQISRNYVQGKRVSYTNPFRFLLSLSIIYFLMINFTENYSKIDVYGLEGDNDQISQVLSFDEKEAEKAIKTLDSLNIRVSESSTGGTKAMLENPKGYFDSISNQNTLGRYSEKASFFTTLRLKKRIKNYEDAVNSIGIEDTEENRRSYKLSGSIMKVMHQPGTFISDFISKLPFIIFLFLPIFSFFIWLFYSKKKFNYVEHLIFSFHAQTMFTILLIFAFILNYLTSLDITFLALIAFMIYLYIAMRRFYDQSYLKTTLKFAILNTIFFTLALNLFIVIVIGSILTY